MSFESAEYICLYSVRKNKNFEINIWYFLLIVEVIFGQFVIDRNLLNLTKSSSLVFIVVESRKMT